MQIITVGKDKFNAVFNKRSLSITNDGQIKAVDTATGEVIDGAELRSVRRLVEWHISSKRDSNHLPALWTVRK